MACSQVGTTQTIGIYLEDIALSLGTTSTDLGLALGLFTAFTCFPGFGHCVVTMSSIIALDQHSNSENFHLLYAVGMSGAGLGMVLLPFLAEVIGQTYGWRGGLLVLGGLMTHMIPCAVAIQVEQPSREKHAMERLPTTDTQERCSFEDQCRPLLSTLSGCLTKPTVVYMGAAWLNVCVILCDVFTNHYYIMAGTACLTTMSIAGMTVLGPLAVRERASPDVFDVAYAVHELFFGLGTFLGCYLSGKVCAKF
eukprot:XP_011668056.1 PREDICTED: monocarboxylate transporter 6-like [Strongylocentrotus purpuratus]